LAIAWSYSIDGIDWAELEALYRAAPLGNKSAAGLATVFANSPTAASRASTGDSSAPDARSRTAPTARTSAMSQCCRRTRAAASAKR